MQHITPTIRSLFLGLCIVVSSIAYATEYTVPAGFENITEDYIGPVGVYFQNQELTNVEIDFRDKADTITISPKGQKNIFNAIAPMINIEGQTALKTLLQNEIPAHAEQTNSYAVYSNDTINTYFSVNTLQLFFIVPNKWLTEKMLYAYKKHHPSTPHRNPALTSHLRVDFDEFNDREYYIQTNGFLSSSNIRVGYDANNYIEDNVNDLYLEYTGKNYIYQTGYIESYARTRLAPRGNLWGVRLTESTKTLNPRFYTAYKSPLIITLNTGSLVKVLYRGRQLYRSNLSQGTHIIPTHNFPRGSYTIDIEEKNLVTGEETVRSELFTAQSGQYNWIYSGLELTIGEQSRYFTSLKDDHKTYIHLQHGYGFLGGDLEVSLTHANDENFFELDYDSIVHSNLGYNLSAAVSGHGSSYVGSSVQYRFGRSRLNLRFSNGYQDNLYDSGRQKHAYLNYNYRLDNTRFYLSGRYNHHDNYSVNSSLSYTQQLRGIKATTRFAASYHHDHGFQSTVRLSCTFRNRFGGTSAAIKAGNQVRARNLILTNFFRQNHVSMNSRMNINLDGHDGNSLYSWLSINADAAKIHGDLNIIEGRDNQYSLGAQTYAVLTPQGLHLGSERANSGYLFNLPVIDSSKTLYYKINNDERKQGSSYFVNVPAFRSKSFSIAVTDPNYEVDVPVLDHFFYPSNVVAITPKVSKVCFVNFTTDFNADTVYTIKGKQQDFFNYGQMLSTVPISSGTPLTLQYLNAGMENQLCETGIVINCDTQFVDLGMVQCQPKSKPSPGDDGTHSSNI